MAVRHQHNRRKTEPWGTNFDDVLKRAKAFFKDGVFYIAKYQNIYSAERPSVAFKDPDDARYYQKQGRWWTEVKI